MTVRKTARPRMKVFMVPSTAEPVSAAQGVLFVHPSARARVKRRPFRDDSKPFFGPLAPHERGERQDSVRARDDLPQCRIRRERLRHDLAVSYEEGVRSELHPRAGLPDDVSGFPEKHLLVQLEGLQEPRGHRLDESGKEFPDLGWTLKRTGGEDEDRFLCV